MVNKGCDVEKSFIIALAEASGKPKPPRKPLGQWLVENMPRGTNLEIPSRRDPERAIPFVIPSEE